MNLHEADELGGARARFAGVAVGWRLDAVEVARLLGLEGDWADTTLMEIVAAVGQRGERSMRLLCEVDRLIGRLVPHGEVGAWLRQPGVGYEDETLTPLQALSTGPSAVRNLRDYLESLPPIRMQFVL